MLCLVILGLGLDFIRKKTNQEDIVNYEKLEKELFKKVSDMDNKKRILCNKRRKEK